MGTVAHSLMEAVEHLPPASVLVLDDVAWDDYELLLEALLERPGVRVTYDRGRLEIVTTSPGHERWKEFVLSLLRVLCQETNVNLESYGGTTWKRKRDRRGTEADTCFYVANAARMFGRDKIDIEADPPPDVSIEVDKSNQSLTKFPIYAAFGVPEIWRCDVRRKTVRMYELRGGSYVEIESSRSFPILNGSVLLKFVELSGTQGQTTALAAFREWLTHRLHRF
jgi:Uma2 family endonuclease